MPGTLTVIWWRDIPAQVIAKDRRRASKVVLHPRFQVAIDKAAEKAGRKSMDDYIAEWHKEQRDCGDDLEAAATEEAARLEKDYTKERLAGLVTSGGVASGGVAEPQKAEPEKAEPQKAEAQKAEAQKAR